MRLNHCDISQRTQYCYSFCTASSLLFRSRGLICCTEQCFGCFPNTSSIFTTLKSRYRISVESRCMRQLLQKVSNMSFPFLPSHSAIDLLYGGIYCFVCQDYIYDKDMEQIAKEEQRKAWKLQGGCCCHTFHTCFCFCQWRHFSLFSSSALLNLHMFKCDMQHLAQYKDRFAFPDGSSSAFKAAEHK